MIVGALRLRDATRGPEAQPRPLHEQAFDAHPQLQCLLVDGEESGTEADFVGNHIGEYAGIPATGKEVRVPYSVVYDLVGEQFSGIRTATPGFIHW